MYKFLRSSLAAAMTADFIRIAVRDSCTNDINHTQSKESLQTIKFFIKINQLNQPVYPTAISES